MNAAVGFRRKSPSGNQRGIMSAGTSSLTAYQFPPSPVSTELCPVSLMERPEVDGLEMLRQQHKPCLAAHVEHVPPSCRLSIRILSDADGHQSIDKARYINVQTQ